MRDVTLRRLEVFVAVADEGSFAAAAERLAIAQPSVSDHVQALERYAGGPLFERRRGRAPVLTDLGRNCLDHARQLIAEASEMTADMVRHRSDAGRRVVFGCQRSLANFVFRKAIADFAVRHPEIQLVVRIGFQEEVVSQVRDGIADVGCLLGDEDVVGLHSEVLGRQRLVLLAAAGHPLAGRRRLPVKELERHGFVSPPRSSGFGKTIFRQLAQIGLRNVRTVAQATEYQFVRELVIAGVGISCSLEKSAEADLASDRAVVLDVDAPELTLNVLQILSQRRPMSDSVRTFVDYLREQEI